LGLLVWFWSGSGRLGLIRFVLVQSSLVRFGLIYCGLIWFGSVRFGLIRFGWAWFGKILFGSVGLVLVWFPLVGSRVWCLGFMVQGSRSEVEGSGCWV